VAGIRSLEYSSRRMCHERKEIFKEKLDRLMCEFVETADDR
jgi:hypothetical protein